MPGQSQVTVFNGDKSEQFRDGLKKFVEESKRLAKFQNEAGIVKIFDSFEENETAYIIMEYLDGITLKEYLARSNHSRGRSNKYAYARYGIAPDRSRRGTSPQRYRTG